MAEPINVNGMSKEQFKQFLNSFDYVFSDCDGVIWTKSEPFPNAGKFFQKMKENGKKIHFVSNNSTRAKEEYKKMFDKIQMENAVDNLTVPSTAIIEYLKSINFNKTVYSISCPQTTIDLKANGIKCKVGLDVGSDHLGDYVMFLQDDEEIGAIVMDSDFKVSMPKLYEAITYLKRPDVLFINGATDRKVPFGGGRFALGPGVFTDIIANETNRTPILLGKPGKEFGMLAMKRAGATDPSRVLFIGDMIEQDVGLGKSSGFQTLLVLTCYQEESMMSHAIKPDYYAKDLGSMVPLFD